MTIKRLPTRRLTSAVAGAASLMLVTTACGASAGSNDPDASLDEMEPVTLQVQSSHGQDAAASRAYRAWQKAVEDASDSNLSFEMFYSDALAPITEVEDALDSGLIDIGTHAPMYDGARFPTESNLQFLNSMVEPTPIAGTLQGIGAQTEFAFDDLYESPFEEQGVKPLIIPMTVIPVYHLGCNGDPVRSLEEAKGKRVRVPSEHLSSEVEALGMTPTATTISEVYEALERGVVDCILAPPADIRDLGLIDVIDHWLIDPEVMWTGVSGVYVSISMDTWDSLPLEAQQLLWDTAAEAFLPTLTEGLLLDTADALGQATEKGVEFHTWTDDARQALSAYHADTVASTAESLENGDEAVARFQELHEEWLAALPESGFDPEASDDTFESFDVASIDFDAFVERLKEARSPGRP